MFVMRYAALGLGHVVVAPATFSDSTCPHQGYINKTWGVPLTPKRQNDLLDQWTDAPDGL